MMKGSIIQEYKTILNTYVPNNRMSKYEAETNRLTEKKKKNTHHESTITVRDFNTPLSVMNRSSGQKISKDLVELYITIHQLDIIEIYSILHPTKQNIYSSQTHMEYSPR